MRPPPSPRPISPARCSDNNEPRAARLAIVGIACAAVVLAPLSLGSSGVWTRLTLEAAMAVMGAIWALFVARSTRASLVILGCCGLALFQLVPLPDSLLTAIAPVSAGTWKVANAGSSTWGTVSIDPAATAVGIRRLLLWLGATVAVKDAASDPAARRAIGFAMAISAVLIWGLGLAFPANAKQRVMLGLFDMRGPTSHWWKSGATLPVQSDGGGFLTWAVVGDDRYRYDEVLVGDCFGPYVSSNQFAGGLSLTLPFLCAAVAFAVQRFGRAAVGHGVIAILMAAATWTLWEKAGSRAGTAALLMTHMAYVAAIAHAGWTRRISTAVAAAYGLLLIVLIAGLVGLLPGLDQWFPQPLQAKVAAFLQDPRAVAANVARRMFLASTILGTGINSYSVAYPRFNPGDFTLYYAYNDYTQVLAETGLVGIAVAIAWAIPLAARIPGIPAVATDQRPLAAAAAAALAGLAAHTAFEWTFHQPANAFLASAVIGLFAATVPRPQRPAKPPATSRRWVSWLAKAAFAAACGLALATLVRDARSDAAVKSLRFALMAARPAPPDSQRPDPKPLLERAFEAGTQAADWDPRNATLQLLTGQVRLHLAQFETGAAREASLSVASRAFRKAQRRRAIVLGLPEPLPREARPGQR